MSVAFLKPGLYKRIVKEREENGEGEKKEGERERK